MFYVGEVKASDKQANEEAVKLEDTAPSRKPSIDSEKKGPTVESAPVATALES